MGKDLYRTGGVAGVWGITRLIDLFNGAGSFASASRVAGLTLA